MNRKTPETAEVSAENSANWTPQRRVSDYLGDLALERHTVMPPQAVQRMLREIQMLQNRQDLLLEELQRTKAALEAADALYLAFYNEAPVGFLTITAKGQISEANLLMETMLGLSRQELVRQPLTRFVFHEDQQDFYAFFKQFFASGEPGSCELRLVNPQGGNLWVKLEATLVRSADDKALCHAAIIDISERKLAAAYLARTAEIQAVLREIAEKAVTTQSMDELYAAVHHLVGRVFPVQFFHIHLLDEATGEIVDLYDGDEQSSVHSRRPAGKGLTEYIMRLGQSAYLTPADIARLREAGEYTPGKAQEVPMTYYLGAPLLDGQLKAFGVVSLFLRGDTQPFQAGDIEVLSIISAQVSLAIDRKRVAEALLVRANIDGLTGLFNRTHFLTSAEEELQRLHRYGGDCSLLMVDIDYFKQVNDTYGHAVGDIALQRVAALCSKAKRASDLLGRVGGEEFSMLLLEADVAEAKRVANRLRQSIQNTVLTTEAKVKIPLRVSIGVAQRQSDNEPLAELMVRADRALYRAKNEGRNRVVTAESTWHKILRLGVRSITDK